MATDKEAIYDDQIFPLMAQVIEICKANKIPVICDFALGFDGDNDSQLKCTTALLSDDFDPTSEMLQAYDLLKPRTATFAAFTISSGG